MREYQQNAVSAPRLPLPPLSSDPPRIIDNVVEWARDDVGIKEEHAEKLRAHEITGDVLSGQTKHYLVLLCGIPVGPATVHAKAIAELLPPDASEEDSSLLFSRLSSLTFDYTVISAEII